MQTNRNDKIELSLKDKNYNPEQNVNFKEVKLVHITNLENTLKTCNYSFIQWKGNARHGDNFLSATGFVVDIDKGTTIQQAEDILKAKNINYALITSKRHTDEANRFHLLIPFSRKVYTKENYKAIGNQIREELFPTLDPNTLDDARYIFGSKDDAFYSSCFNKRNFQVDTSSIISDAWDDNFEVMLLNKNMEVAVNIEIKNRQTVPIYCPFHDDSSPSAFLAYSKDSFNHYIRCMACGKTFWKVQTKNIIALKSEKFWSLGTSVYEAALVGDVFSIENIGKDKYYVKVGAKKKKDKEKYFDHLVKEKHLHRIDRIDNIGDASLDESTFSFDRGNGIITVRVKALPVNIKDNAFIEKYLDDVFGNYKNFIKEYLACYVYTNYKKLPFIILTGERGVGKNTFAESIQEIYPVLSETARDLEDKFNGFAEKKLLIIDESASNGKVQYQMLKKLSGQKSENVNRKYLQPYQAKNNINIIFLSNDDMPVYVDRNEKPTDERNNQFFVYRLQPHGTFDADLQQKLIDRLGHYIRTELKNIFNNLNMTGYRYSIEVPITEEEKKLFDNSITDIESEADHIAEVLENKINDSSWNYYLFTKAGIIPTEFFSDMSNGKVSKIKVIQNLQKRGYISREKTERYQQINGKRPYSYKLGQVLLGLRDQKVSVGISANSHLDSHFEPPTDTAQQKIPF